VTLFSGLDPSNVVTTGAGPALVSQHGLQFVVPTVVRPCICYMLTATNHAKA